MAIDTQVKRFGVLSDGPPQPDGTIEQADRQLLVDLFGVADGGAPPATTGIHNPFHRPFLGPFGGPM